MQAWRQQSVLLRLIAVNLSARQFQHPGLVQQVKSALHDSALPASCLELEITESILMKEVDVSVNVMRELAELGVQFSIDDFGTGYSSRAYLKSCGGIVGQGYYLGRLATTQAITSLMQIETSETVSDLLPV